MFVKLVRYGLSLKVLKLLSSMYSQLQSCVKIGHRTTNFFETNVGVRQGCNLSPTLFNLIFLKTTFHLKMTYLNVFQLMLVQ